MQIPSFKAIIQKSIIDNWDRDALTDYKGATLQYHDVARKIEKLHIMFENSGVVKGDKIALCGRNSANWAVAFLATVTYGAVAVPILHEFTADQVHNIVNHSEAKLLFVGDVVATTIDATKMPHLEGIIYIPDYSIVVSRTDKLTYAREHLNEMFGKKYPKYFRKEHVNYCLDEDPNELALINYTSGTTGFSKGVMIPFRAMWSNYDFAEQVLGKVIKKGDNTISILPMAHMYGMAFEFVFEFLHGCHIFYLTRVPSPAIIAQAFADIRPAIIIAVPLIIEKIIRKNVNDAEAEEIFCRVVNLLKWNKQPLKRATILVLAQTIKDVAATSQLERVLSDKEENLLYDAGFRAFSNDANGRVRNVNSSMSASAVHTAYDKRTPALKQYDNFYDQITGEAKIIVRLEWDESANDNKGAWKVTRKEYAE